jgi:RNA polymerase sigma factor (TIGR02999 family)
MRPPADSRRPMSTPETPPDAPEGDITLLLRRVEGGDAQAADKILPLVYDELRKLAAAKMARESPGQTLQPTALVHEAWLRLGGDRQPSWQNRAHFFAAAAEAMRRILVDNARRRRAERHGGALQKVSLNQTGFDVAVPQLDDEGLIQLDEALGRLAAHDPRKAEVVKLCHFVGLTLEEAAGAMGISDRTAKRDWTYARAWLFKEMKAMQRPSA